MGGKNSVNNRCRIAKYFRRNEIEVAPISSALLRIACLVILYKTCRVPDQELAADGVSGPVCGLALDYLSKMKIAVMVRQLDLEGNAPHDRPSFLVCHLIGNRASFLCTKAPMLRIPETNFLQGITSISGRDVSGDQTTAAASSMASTEFQECIFWTNAALRSAG